MYEKLRGFVGSADLSIEQGSPVFERKRCLQGKELIFQLSVLGTSIFTTAQGQLSQLPIGTFAELAC